MPSRTSPVTRYLACLLFAAAGTALADAPPRIVAVEFSGNEATQESVLLREMVVRAGDPADAELIERSRQAILDLGLFREVDAELVPSDEGVILRIRMNERRYLLPVPRVDASSDRDTSYGGQLRWNNVYGLNHTLDARYLKGDHPDDRLRESETSARLYYDAPYLFNERDGAFIELERIDRVVPGQAGSFDEDIDRMDLRFYRDFRESRPRRGWIGTAGLRWQSQDASGTFAPPADGDSTALVVGADYSDFRFHVYSETGTRFSSQLELASDALLSDYSYRKLEAEYREHIGLDTGDHHSLHLITGAGWMSGGPGRVNEFSLGGSGRLRGYGNDFIEGQRYVWGAVEYLRPLYWDWLRLLVLAEAGYTGGSVVDARSGGPYSSIGLGLRLRVTWFVDVEFEAGVAWPLRGGDGMEVFAGGF